MNRLNELITEFCPQGVEQRKIGELCSLITKQTGFDYSNTIKDALLQEHSPDSVPYIQTKFFTGKKFVYETDYYVPQYIVSKYPRITLSERCLLFSIVGASIGNVGLFPGEQMCFLGGAICVAKPLPSVNVDYLYYCAESEYVQTQIRAKTKGAQATITVDDVREFAVPWPPNEIQKEIVKVLDELSEATEKLSDKLNAELSARKKQYDYYYRILLKGNQTESLSKVATYSRDRINASELTDDTYVGVDNLLSNRGGKRKSDHTPTDGNVTMFQAGDILIGNIRPYLRKIWFADRNGGTSGDVLVIRSLNPERVAPEYLYHVLSSDDFFVFDTDNSKGAKMPRGDKNKIMEFQLYIPPMVKQLEIVETLRRLDEAYRGITVKVSDEIDRIKKQYVYCREKMLSFKAI